MVHLTAIQDTHNISRHVLIAEAINGKIGLYHLLPRGEWRKISPDELKYLPDPEEPYDQPSKLEGEQIFLKLLGLEPLRIAKGLHVKKEDLDDYLSRQKAEEHKKAKGNSGRTRRINTLERFIGALIIANYKEDQECVTKDGELQFQPVQNKLSKQLAIMDFDLDLVGKSLAELTIKPAMEAFLQQQNEKKTKK